MRAARRFLTCSILLTEPPSDGRRANSLWSRQPRRHQRAVHRRFGTRWNRLEPPRGPAPGMVSVSDTVAFDFRASLREALPAGA